MIPLRSIISNLPNQFYSLISNIQYWNSVEIDTTINNSNLKNMVYELIHLGSVPYMDSASIKNYSQVCKKWSEINFKGMLFTKKTIKLNVPYHLNRIQIESLKITLKGNSLVDEFSDSFFAVRYIKDTHAPYLKDTHTTYLISRTQAKIHSIPSFNKDIKTNITSYGTIFEKAVKKIKLYFIDDELNRPFNFRWDYKHKKEVTFELKNLQGNDFRIRIYKTIISDGHWKYNKNVISKEELLNSVPEGLVNNEEFYTFETAV